MNYRIGETDLPYWYDMSIETISLFTGLMENNFRNINLLIKIVQLFSMNIIFFYKQRFNYREYFESLDKSNMLRIFKRAKDIVINTERSSAELVSSLVFVEAVVKLYFIESQDEQFNAISDMISNPHSSKILLENQDLTSQLYRYAINDKNQEEKYEILEIAKFYIENLLEQICQLSMKVRAAIDKNESNTDYLLRCFKYSCMGCSHLLVNYFVHFKKNNV